MFRVKKQFSFLIVIISLLLSCDTNVSKSPKFEITSVTEGMKSYGSPFLKITIKNVGDATGYNVGCDVQAKKGSTIIDTGFAYFANGSDIAPGESAIDEAIFFELESHNDYSTLDYKCDWLKR